MIRKHAKRIWVGLLSLVLLTCVLPAAQLERIETLRISAEERVRGWALYPTIEALVAGTPTAVPLPTRSQFPTATPQPTPTPAPTEEPGPQGRIVFTCQVDKNPSHDQICVINADGTGLRQLTEDMDFQHFYPSWAPDGNSILFSASQAGEFKIYELDLRTGEMAIVGDISGDLYAPAVSPDGEQIVFTRHFSESEQYISVCDRDGSNVRNLTGYYDARDPVWSPDGKKILFSSLHNGTPQLYIMDTEGLLKQQVSEMVGLRGRTDWSEDLAIVTYAGEYEERNREIVLLELGGQPQVLTQGGDNLAPSFSPDGEWLAFMSYRDNFWQADGCELYVMRRDGSDVRRLTDNDYCDYQPRWGP